jgi:hypothetical protein
VSGLTCCRRAFFVRFRRFHTRASAPGCGVCAICVSDRFWRHVVHVSHFHIRTGITFGQTQEFDPPITEDDEAMPFFSEMGASVSVVSQCRLHIRD